MRISYSWLKEFVDIPEMPAQLAARLTDVGLALDALDTVGGDAIFEFDVATNRPDCLSHIGIARETSVIYRSPLRRPTIEFQESSRHATDVISISIADPELCSRYCGRYMAGVKIAPSPDWLKARLESLGIRSINNVADVTNYVLLETGQPLHAFDADTLAGGQIIVRRAGIDEELTTLDGVTRKLSPSVLLIADAKRGIAVAGVMGGAETEITPDTTNVLIESANFDPLSIRKTSRMLGLSTEASYRFERGADIEMAHLACDRAAAMIQQLAGGQIHFGLIDVYPRTQKTATVHLRRERIKGFLGMTVAEEVVETILKQLEFRVTRTEDGWDVGAPSHRIDISREEDLIEEIARHHGFDKIPATLPTWSGHGSALPLDSEEEFLRERLEACGYTETTPMAFSDEPIERKFRPDVKPVKLLNPMAEDQAILRTSLVPSMLRTLQWNINRGMRNLQFYELGKIYRDGGENRTLIMAATGFLREKTVHESAREFNFFDLKGDVSEILEKFHAPTTVQRDDLPPYYHPGRCARMERNAFLGELHAEYAEIFKLRQRVYIAEIEIEALLRAQGRYSIQAIPRFPAIRRDLSLLVDKGVRYDQIRSAIPEFPELISVEAFDRLEKGSFPESKYSLSISFTYQSPDRTMTDAEVEIFESTILTALGSAGLGIEQRK